MPPKECVEWVLKEGSLEKPASRNHLCDKILVVATFILNKKNGGSARLASFFYFTKKYRKSIENHHKSSALKLVTPKLFPTPISFQKKLVLLHDSGY